MASFDWAVGLFEGEGTIGIRARPGSQITLQLASVDADVVRRFRDVVGFGKVYGPYQYGVNRQPYWKWNGDGGLAVAFLREAVPLLGLRRGARATEAIAQWTSRQASPYYTVSRKGMGGRPTHKARAVPAIVRDEDYPLGERVGG